MRRDTKRKKEIVGVSRFFPGHSAGFAPLCAGWCQDFHQNLHNQVIMSIYVNKIKIHISFIHHYRMNSLVNRLILASLSSNKKKREEHDDRGFFPTVHRGFSFD